MLTQLLSYAFRLDKRIVNINQPPRNFADEAEMVVGVVMSRVRLATSVPLMSLQSATGARIEPAARSLPSVATPPTPPTTPNQLFPPYNPWQAFMQHQMMAMFMGSPQSAPLNPLNQAGAPSFNLNMQMSPMFSSPPGDSRKRDREDDSSAPPTPSKLPRPEGVPDVSASKPQEPLPVTPTAPVESL